MSAIKEKSTKTALITGGTSGIGLSIARELILLDFHVVLVGRNRERGKAIESELNKIRSNTTQFIELDLSKVKSVHEFAIQFMKDFNRLDILANIAGVMLPKRQATSEGLEMTFAVNYLSAFVLSTTLSPLLEKTEGARIVNVGAMPSQNLKPSINFDDMQSEIKYSGFQLGTTIVHAKTVLTQILSEKYVSNGIDVISFDPGLIRSNLMSNMPLALRIIMKLMGPLMAKTSTTGVYVCSSKELKGVTGVLVQKKKFIPLNFEKSYRYKLLNYSEALVSNILK